MANKDRLKTNLAPAFSAYNRILGGSGNSLRTSQLQFIIACQEAISNELPIVIEGPTGLGKTKALLTVASAFLKSNEKAKVLYTSRTMPQLENVVDDLYEVHAKDPNALATEGRDFEFAVYIGVNSLRRLFCSKHIEQITFDDKKLAEFRALLHDPDEPESCPDCPLKDIKNKIDENNPCFTKRRFGHKEIDELIMSNLCPLKYMKEASKSASIIVSTYPYLFNDHWKAVYLGSSKERINCLPILDEAHNIIENIADQPALSIHLTRKLKQGQGMDLNSNSYALTYLIDRVKYGYRDMILGPINRIYNKICSVKNEEYKATEDEITILKHEVDSIHEQHEFAKKQRNLLVQYREIIKNGEYDGRGIFIEHETRIEKCSRMYAAAKIKKLELNKLHKYRKKFGNTIKALGDSNKDRQKRSAELKILRNNIVNPAWNSSAYYQREKYHKEIEDLSENWQFARDQIIGMKKQIEEISLLIDEVEKEQSRLFISAGQINSEVYESLSEEMRKTHERISKLNSEGKSLYKKLKSQEQTIKKLKQDWNNLKKEALDPETNRKTVEDFCTEHNIDRSVVMTLKSSLDSGFSIFSYLNSFRDSLSAILSETKPGPIDGSTLSIMTKDLNEQLSASEKTDFFQFLELTEKAIEMFEEEKLRTGAIREGQGLYAFRQLFRTLAAIIHGPYGFAGHLSKEEGYHSITFSSLDPAIRFKEAYFDLKPPVLASATISPVEDVVKVLGLDNGLRVKLEPVFPPENYLSYAFMGVNSSRANHENEEIFNSLERDILRNNIANILSNTKKHTGLFCASHNVLDDVLLVIDKKLINSCGMKLLVARSDNVGIKDDFDELKTKCDQGLTQGLNGFDSRLKLYNELAGKIPIVIAGVSGGGLAEGVDYRGNLMELAIIIGIPYQDEGDKKWINDKRTGFFKMREGNLETGKDLAYRQSALRKIAQTVGRVHRTMNDRGIIVFFDERLLGIKNNGASGVSRYEILNSKNTGKHWDIIQKRVYDKLRIVAPAELGNNETRDLSKHVNKVFKNNDVRPEIIQSPECFAEIKIFYSN